MLDFMSGVNDYKSIKTYEDACDALCEKVDEVALTNAGVPNHIIALMKLELICKTLWGGNFKEVNKYTAYYFPLFRFFTKEDVKYMNNEEMCAILPVHVGYNRALVIWGILV